MATHLLHHMQKQHVRAELPYFCHICSFRSSKHTDVVEHFQIAHDRTDKLQCPLCLKTTGRCSHLLSPSISSSLLQAAPSSRSSSTSSLRPIRGEGV